MSESNNGDLGEKPGEELSGVLRAAVTAVRDEPLPELSLDRALEHAREIGQSRETVTSDTNPTRQRGRPGNGMVDDLASDLSNDPRSRFGFVSARSDSR